MKIPKIFIPDKDLTNKIKEYVEHIPTNTPLYITLKENKELYDQIVDNMVQKFGYNKDRVEIILEHFCSYIRL